MCKAWEAQAQLPDCDSLSFEERLGLLGDRELTERDTRRLQTRLRTAKLRQPAPVEDIDSRQPRGLDQTRLTRLVTCQWIADHAPVLITGPPGVGKTWLACAWAPKAWRAGYTAQDLR